MEELDDRRIWLFDANSTAKTAACATKPAPGRS